MPIIILGLVAMSCVVVAYPLNETMNIKLPDTVEAAEMFGAANVKPEDFLERKIKQFKLATSTGGLQLN